MTGDYRPGDIISHTDMSVFEGFHAQAGMNFRTGRGGVSVFLMSTTSNAPYEDQVLDNGRAIIYEGHDIRKDHVEGDPKEYDQPLVLPSGKPTANGKFFDSASSGLREKVRVYEKLKAGIWIYNGVFILEDAHIQESSGRSVIKFRLSIVDEQGTANEGQGRDEGVEMEQTRMIPSRVKFEVYKRDGGQCVRCGSKDNLHYDHILPYSRGGTSLMTENIQLLCARHNLQKSNKIQ